MRLRLVIPLLLLLLAGSTRATAQSVFDGDPIDPETDLPYVIPPAAPLFAPGKDEKFGTDDDVVQTGTRGDVDLVLRSVAFGGAFPAPAAGVAAAPVVIAGGAATGLGTDAHFQVGLSDGATSPPAGHPLHSNELDGRGVLVLAYPDLDGDGFIGPTARDGNADNEIEIQEVLEPIGRQVAGLNDGGANGDIGVSLGAPASVGGLGVILSAAALAGDRAPLYTDGSYILTQIPLLPPIEVRRVVTGNARPPDPNYLVDVELEVELGEASRWFIPRPGDPVLGEPYAIPLDGSSVSVDLLQARSGPAVGASLARPVGSEYRASLSRRLLPAVGAGGGRLVVEAIDEVTIDDDGPGHGFQVAVFAADVLGNPTDASAGGMKVELEVGSGLEIVSPNTDGNPRRETVTLSSAEAVIVALDDPGGAGDGPLSDRLTALVDGVPTASVRVNLRGGSAPSTIALANVQVGFRGNGHDFVRAFGRFPATSAELASQDVTISLSSNGTPIFSRVFPAGSLSVRRGGRRFDARDPVSVVNGRVSFLASRSPLDPSLYRLRLLARNLDIGGTAAALRTATLTIQVGSKVSKADLACAASVSSKTARCR